MESAGFADCFITISESLTIKAYIKQCRMHTQEAEYGLSRLVATKLQALYL